MEILKSWLSPSKKTIGFEDIKFAIRNSSQFILINTLSNLEQNCLIYGTIPYDKEETIINQRIDNRQLNTHIILYGKNSTDDSVIKKQNQLIALGFINVYIFSGGMFEWLLLQDIYGFTEFPTTTKCKDMIKYRPSPLFSSLPQITL